MKHTVSRGRLTCLTVLAASTLLTSTLLSCAGQHAMNTPGGATGTAEYGPELGTVQFPVSCNDAASHHAEQGLALLHHMTYQGARTAFIAAAQADPECAMAYWGQAMSYIHPLWSDPPSETEFANGQALLDEAGNRGARTPWEEAYITAASAYYAEGRQATEKANLVAFETGWQAVHERFPEDPEAASFYALAHLANADPADKGYVRQKKATEIAEAVRARVPEHPGVHHYIIHANDYPPLAETALPVAHHYGEIAPAVPHALHMPTHIFTRQGLWRESIDMNQRSAEAALQHPAGDELSLHYLHALDYLAYAYLQIGEDDEADAVMETIEALTGPYQAHVASAYTLAAVPARIALERQQWSKAASLQAQTPKNYPWERFPAMEAITHFARALGAAHSGNEKQAREALDQLAMLRDRTAQSSQYWANQVEIQRLSAQAWMAYQGGKQQEAVKTMTLAAEMEADTEKHPVTPGEILPAAELLGDMLLERGDYLAAHKTYLAALERSPNRLNSLYGAGRSAELAGDREAATRNYAALTQLVTPNAQSDKVKHARDFLSEN